MDEKLKAIITDTLDVDPAQVTDSARFDELGADSLDAVEMIVQVERQYSIRIPDIVADGFETVADLSDYVRGHVS